MTKAIYSNTFQTFDEEHIKLIKQESKNYDQLFVVVMNLGEKDSLLKQRFDHIKSFDMPKNVMVLMLPKGLLTTLARQMHIDILLRSYRTNEELIIEEELAKQSRVQQSHIKTIFIKND